MAPVSSPTPPVSFQLAPALQGPPAAERLQPRQWQRQLVQLLRARLGRPCAGGHDVLVHAGPGAGKTMGGLLSFQALQREGRLQRLVVFCHRSSIAGQWQQTAARLGLQLRRWEGSAWEESRWQGRPDEDSGWSHTSGADTRLEPDEPRAEAAGEPGGFAAAALLPGTGLLLSYQGAARHRRRLEALLADPALGPWLAIADEVHHLGVDPDEPEAAAWGHAFSSLTSTAALRLGLTGTPFRADNLAFCAARRVKRRQGEELVEHIDPDLSVEPRQLILAGDVRPLEFRFQDGWVEHGRPLPGSDRETSPLSAEERESWRARNLRRAIQPGDGSGIARRLLTSAREQLLQLRREHAEAGGMVMARDIGHARRLAALLQEQGDRVHLVHSQDPEATSHLAAYRAGQADWLVSIDMCAEGFDAPRVRVVAYLTTVVTRSRFVQAITRAVRMDGERAALEPIPRHPSYVFAPADPRLMDYARSWSLSQTYVVRLRQPAAAEEPAGAAARFAGLPLQAIDEQAGSMIHLRGPELPPFLARASQQRRTA